MTTEVYTGVRDIMAAPDWEPVTVTDHGHFYTISGFFRSMAHTGSRVDWESLARDLDQIAREQFDALMGEAKPAAEAVAEPVVEAAPEPTPEPEPEPAPEPQPDPRDAELEAMRAEIETLRAAKRELEERELELRDANATLKDALADIEDRIADLDDDFPAPDEKLSDWDVVGAEPEKLEPDDAAKLEADLHEGEAITAANKKRLFRTLNEELGRLKNQEALLGVSVPRRAEVESLLGILARVGDA
jgi:hypothetical protein